MTTIKEINDTIKNTFISDPEVITKYELVSGKTFDEQFSVVSIERILFYAVSVGIWISINFFGEHKTEILQMLNEQLAHRPNWYAYKAKQFQFGAELIPDTDRYDNAGLTEEQITAMQVVKYAAVVDVKDRSLSLLKIATSANGKKQPLSENQLIAFKTYMLDHVADSGVRLSIINDVADDMKLSIDIYYNALLLNNQGQRLDGTSDTPIQDVIRTYLDNLPFNGTYTNMQLVDAIQQVDGVVIVELKSASSRYGTYTEFSEINAREVAHAGCYQISDQNLILNFIAYE